MAILPRQAAKFYRDVSHDFATTNSLGPFRPACRVAFFRAGDRRNQDVPGTDQWQLPPRSSSRDPARSKEKEAGLKPLVALLSRDKQLLSRIAFAQGQSRIALEDVLGLPTDLKDGLSGGTYVLSLEDGTESTTFTVASVEERSRVLRRAEEIAGFLGRANPLYLQVAVEHLLTETDDGKKSRPFVGAALRLLESAPVDSQTPYLRNLHEDVLRRLGVPASPSKPAIKHPDETTGIAEIDQILQLDAQGRWAEALESLQRLKSDAAPQDGRVSALEGLCRAMILADSGLETEERADVLFGQALAALDAGPAADRYRAHNEFANSLLNRVEDRLYNSAVQRAAGVPHPLFTALEGWCAARQHYEIALEVARRLGPRPTAVVQVNLARQYVVLADLIRTMGSPHDGDSPLSELERASLQVARSLTAQILDRKSGSHAPTMLKGIAEEITAHADLREGKLAACLDAAKRSLGYFIQVGSLAGAESSLRLSGTSLVRMARHGDPAAAKSALADLSVSHCLAELLAERIPAGHTGRLLAGFFDRRAYVSAQLIELLLDQKQPAAALQHAEEIQRAAYRRCSTCRTAKSTRRPAHARRPSCCATGRATSWPSNITSARSGPGSSP